MSTALAVKEDFHIDESQIRQHFASNATEKEFRMFLELCKLQKLNPFTREVYFVKYGSSPGQVITAWQVFIKRADEHPQFDGMEVEYHLSDGFTVSHPVINQVPESCTGIVYRKDRRFPSKASVLFSEYDTGKSNWAKMPWTMIRKVALSQALREAFPSEFHGLYSSEEMEQAQPQARVVNTADEPPVESQKVSKTSALKDKIKVVQPVKKEVNHSEILTNMVRDYLSVICDKDNLERCISELRQYAQEHKVTSETLQYVRTLIDHTNEKVELIEQYDVFELLDITHDDFDIMREILLSYAKGGFDNLYKTLNGMDDITDELKELPLIIEQWEEAKTEDKLRTGE